jgi:hypothetical protein
MTSLALAKVTASYEAGLAHLTLIASAIVPTMCGFQPSPAHLDDIVSAAVDLDPAALAAATRANEITDGLRSIVRAALTSLKEKRPRLFAHPPSRDAYINTAVAEYFGARGCTTDQRASVAQEFDLSGADGREGVRSAHVARCERLDAAGKSHLIDTTPHSPSSAGLFGSRSDPREAAHRAGNLPDKALPQVGASRADMIALERRGQIAGEARPKVQMVKLLDHDGNVVSVPAHVSADYQRLRGYRLPPSTASSAEGLDDDVPAKEESAETSSPSPSPRPPDPFSRLQALRAEAREAGVNFDPTWGLSRLALAIKASKQNEGGGAPAPPASPFENAAQPPETAA